MDCQENQNDLGDMIWSHFSERMIKLKKNVSISLPLLWILIGSLLVSIFGNISQFKKANDEKSLKLEGSYCVDASAPGLSMPYLVFDDEGHYCKYTQTEGLLDEGVYTQDSPQQYHLVGKSGFSELIILEEDGVYYISDSEGLSSMFLSRFSDVLVFFSGSSPSWAKKQSDELIDC